MDLSGVPVKFHGKINPLILANAVVVVIFWTFEPAKPCKTKWNTGLQW
jgi:hypothetical protein